MRFTERHNDIGSDASTFSLLDARGNVVGAGRPGQTIVLETATERLHLQQSSFAASGPDDPSVEVRFVVSFKPAAAGRTYAAELPASDEQGRIQGADVAGTFTVGTRFNVYLPIVLR